MTQKAEAIGWTVKFSGAKKPTLSTTVQKTRKDAVELYHDVFDRDTDALAELKSGIASIVKVRIIEI